MLKVSKFQNEFTKSYFGRNDDFINSFWNLLTFNCILFSCSPDLSPDSTTNSENTNPNFHEFYRLLCHKQSDWLEKLWKFRFSTRLLDLGNYWGAIEKATVSERVSDKVNSVQEACAKCFAVHTLKFEILQTTWKNKTSKS